MSDLEQLRVELRAATTPPHDIPPAAGVGPLIRERARRRRRTRALAAGGGLAVIGVALAVLFWPGAGTNRTAPPAGDGPSVSVSAGPVVTPPSGPRRLATPIELREMVGTPPCGSSVPDIVPAAEILPAADGGTTCFQVEAPKLVVDRVTDMTAIVEPDPTRPGENRTVLVLTLPAGLRDRLIETVRPIVGFSTAVVVNGRVYISPGLGDTNPDGKLRLSSDRPDVLANLVRRLTG